jgi:UDP-GlcNAc:undecaprenyl-phosphate GlcNAc-1-phosphate transferase
MKDLAYLLQINLNFADYKFSLLCFVTAFTIAMVCIPLVILIVNKYKLLDHPDFRKHHTSPTPTLGGIAIMTGMLVSILVWFPYSFNSDIATCFFSMVVLFGLGIADDLIDVKATYKFVIEIFLAGLIAYAGIRITTFGGLFGIEQLPVSFQYIFTILAIVGITNAFNLIDGIDGLAGGLSFMSLVTLGFFLTISGDKPFAIISFALAGAVFAFLYFNMNPARIFMGDTGSLVLGFTTAILCIRLMHVNSVPPQPFLKNAPMFALAIVLIPVFDTVRVFLMRLLKGGSPFHPDKTHIHHLVTNAGFSHSTTSRVICVVHALILVEVFWLKDLRPELILCLLLLTMIVVTLLFYNIHFLKKYLSGSSKLDLK